MPIYWWAVSLLIAAAVLGFVGLGRGEAWAGDAWYFPLLAALIIQILKTKA